MTVWKKIRGALSFVMAALIISFCTGAAAYLAETAVKEPLMTIDYCGTSLYLSLAGEEQLLDLTIPEKLARRVQEFWIFLPPGIRLAAQSVTWSFQYLLIK